MNEQEIQKRIRELRLIPKREPLFYGKSYEEIIKKKYQRRTIADGSDINRMEDDSSTWYEMIERGERLE